MPGGFPGLPEQYYRLSPPVKHIQQAAIVSRAQFMDNRFFTSSRALSPGPRGGPTTAIVADAGVVVARNPLLVEILRHYGAWTAG